MTPPDVVLELRPASAGVVAFVGSLGVAAWMVVMIVGGGFDGASALFFLLVLAGITGYNMATVLSRVRARADGSLEVRNRFSTRRLTRTDVDRVIEGRAGGFGSAHRLELLLTDGAVVPLVATESPFPWSRRRVQEQAEQLRAWVSETTRPYRG